MYSIGGVGLEIEISGYKVLIDDDDWIRLASIGGESPRKIKLV